MCGVIGAYAIKPSANISRNVERIFIESRIRGRHAFGFSNWSNGLLDTHKFLDVIPCVKALPSSITCLIGHARYSTSGDFKNIENNQPLELDGSSLAFNGVISMATKLENEAKYGQTYRADNDGEIFLDKFNRDDGWESFVSTGRFSFAGLVLKDGCITAIRNESRPLYSCKTEEAVYVASTRDIFLRADIRGDYVQVPVGKAVRIDRL